MEERGEKGENIYYGDMYEGERGRYTVFKDLVINDYRCSVGTGMSKVQFSCRVVRLDGLPSLIIHHTHYTLSSTLITHYSPHSLHIILTLITHYCPTFTHPALFVHYMYTVHSTRYTYPWFACRYVYHVYLLSLYIRSVMLSNNNDEIRPSKSLF